MSTTALPQPWPAPIGIIGTGAVGTALVRLLRDAGLPVVAIGSRQPERVTMPFAIPVVTATNVASMADLVILAVPDSAIAALAASFSWRSGQWVVHCAGTLPAAILLPVIGEALAGAWHPLAPFPRGNPATPASLRGHVIAIDGPPEVISGLRALTLILGALPVQVPPEARPAYHLSAVMVSNLTLALVETARQIWTEAGLDPALALPALLPLLEATIANLAEVGLPAALTGPLTRGDEATISRHLAVLANQPTQDFATIYRLLSLQAIEIVRAQGRLSPEALQNLQDILSR